MTDKKQQYRLILYNTGFSALFVIVSLIIFLPKAQGIFFPQDEFGYWGNAARLAGIDWSELLSKQSDYAYGYSILLLPLMKLIKDPVMMYKAAIIINGILVLASSTLISWLVIRLDIEDIFVCLACSFFPPLLVYMHYTIAESLLFAEFFAMCHVMLSVSEGHMGAGTFLSGGAAGILMALTHYRTVGFILIFLICYAFSYVSRNHIYKINPQKSSLLLLLLFSVFLISGMWICGHTGFGFGKRLYDLSGVAVFAASVLGRFFYLGGATFGLGLIGLYLLFRERDNAFNLFVLMGLVYMILLGSFFFSGDLSFVRLDHLIYGRYSEIFIPILILYGIKYLTGPFPGGRVLMVTVIFMGTAAAFLTLFVNHMGITEYVRGFVSGIDWMFPGDLPVVGDIYERPFIVASAGLFFMYYMLRSTGTGKLCLTAFVISYISASFFMISSHVYKYQVIDIEDRKLAINIDEMQKTGKQIFFLDSPYNDYINLIQFWLKDTPVHITEGLSPEAYDTPSDAVIITYQNYEDPGQLLKRYDTHESSPHFIIYYNLQKP